MMVGTAMGKINPKSGQFSALCHLSKLDGGLNRRRNRIVRFVVEIPSFDSKSSFQVFDKCFIYRPAAVN
jgi:hypothetical protein